MIYLLLHKYEVKLRMSVNNKDISYECNWDIFGLLSKRLYQSILFYAQQAMASGYVHLLKASFVINNMVLKGTLYKCNITNTRNFIAINECVSSARFSAPEIKTGVAKENSSTCDLILENRLY